MEQQSRFKHYLIPSSGLRAEAQSLAPAIAVLEQLLQSPINRDAEICFHFILLYLQQRVPDGWCRKTPQGFEFKNLPESVLRCLRRWERREYQLELIQELISPEQMLRLQAQGQRAVTVDFAAAKEGRLVDGKRDALEFLLHDLVHADLFFNDSNQYRQQVLFFQRIESFMSQSWLQEMLAQDQEMKFRFEYLISDMNSSVHHMHVYLRSLLVDAFKKREGLLAKQSLSGNRLVMIDEVMELIPI